VKELWVRLSQIRAYLKHPLLVAGVSRGVQEGEAVYRPIDNALIQMVLHRPVDSYGFSETVPLHFYRKTGFRGQVD
jgi:hypothetical protein